MVPCFFIAHGASNRHPSATQKKHPISICTLGRTQRTPEPSGPSALPLAQTIAHIVVSDTVVVACPDSFCGSSNSLGTDREDILPALAKAEHDKLNEILGPEGTDDSPERLNIRAPMPLLMGVLMRCSPQQREQQPSVWTKQHPTLILLNFGRNWSMPSR